MLNTSERIGRDEHVWSFDAGRQPVIIVDPGTIIEIETWDCFTGQVQSEDDTLENIDLTRVNSATGPGGQTAVGGTAQEVLHVLRINGAKAPAVTS